MPRKNIVLESVNRNQYVRFERQLHEVVTADGMHLVMSQKIPLGQKPEGYIMFVHGLGQNRYSWSMSSRSMENYFVKQGFSTFNVELRGHGLSRALGSDYPEQFDTYVNFDLPALINAISEITDSNKIFYVGHSLGGAISYCVSSLFEDKLAGVISIAGPFNMGKGNHIIKAAAKVGHLAGKFIPRESRFYPKAFLVDYIGLVAKQGLFVLDSPLFKFPVQFWWPGNMERDVLKERIEKGFDRTGFSLVRYFVDWAARGKFQSSDGRTDYEERVSDLSIPLLFVNGDRDYVVPPSSNLEAYEKAGTRDKTFKVFGGEKKKLHWGHCDLIFGRHAPTIVWPYMLKWIQERN